MRSKILILIAGFAFFVAACSKSEDKRPCETIPAGTALRFRVVDTGGKDVLFRKGIDPEITQPCRNGATLKTVFTTYAIPNTGDTGRLISFDDIRTPTYGEGGECFRIFFKWDASDTDTLDWHYRMESAGDCMRQSIDYLSFNGKQAELKNDNRYTFYRLVK